MQRKDRGSAKILRRDRRRKSIDRGRDQENGNNRESKKMQRGEKCREEIKKI